MKIGIMQPYFFPYLGYFSLIKNTDEFILFDTVQFITHGWIERNRILKPKDGWQYISVPLEKHHQRTNIIDVKINNKLDWENQIMRQIEHYKKRAPYYTQTVNIMKACFDCQTDSITELNCHILITICDYLNIKRPIKVFSKMGLNIEEAKAPDEWALNICKVMDDVTEYWNPEGGITFFDRSKYAKNNIAIKFIKMNLIPYPQRRTTFIPGLSILDVMMFNTKEEIVTMLDDFNFI